MARPRRAATLQVGSLESRDLLSGIPPVLTTRTYNAVVDGVGDVMGTLARTFDFNASSASLTQLSARIPFGRQSLAPTWRGNLDIFDAQVPHSGLAMQNQIIGDLNHYIVGGVISGTFRVTGRGSSAFGSPVLGGVAPSAGVKADSVTIVNATGLPGGITVTASILGSGRTIKQTIPTGGKMLFDFGTATKQPITIRIQRADGGQQPPPADVLLSMPFGGYFGKSFPISVGPGGVFSVGQG